MAPRYGPETQSFMENTDAFYVTVNGLAKMIEDQQLAFRPFVHKYLASAEEELL